VTPVDRPELGSEAPEQATGVTFRNVVALTTVVVIVIALAGLLGYIPGLRALGNIRADYIPMAQSTAACFLIFSTALYLQTRNPLQNSSLTVIFVLVLLGTLFSVMEFSELFFGMDLNYSNKLFPPTDMLGTIPVGRMSPATAATFSITGPGILLLLLRRRTSRYARQTGTGASCLGVLTMLIGATVILAYLFGTPFMYSGGNSVPMAATTALAFLFLGIAVVLSTGPDIFPMCHVTGDSTAAKLSRVFLSLTVTIVLVQSILLHYIFFTQLVNEALIIALLVVIIGTFTVSVVNYVAGLTGNSIDEVNRKLVHTLQELRKSEEQRRSILVTAMDGFWMVDRQGRLLEVNEAYCRITGYSEQELLSMSIFDLEVNETPDATIARIAMLVEQGEARFESRHRHKNGGLIDIEISAQFQSIEDGRIVAFLRDITERKQVEFKLNNALDESHRFREALDHVSSHIYMKDLRSRYVYANRSTLELFSCSTGELVGCDDFRFFPPETATVLRTIDSRVFMGEQTSEEINFVDSDGRQHVYQEVKTPVYDQTERGTIVGLLGISTDITEHKQIEEELKKKNSEVEQFIYSVSHDLRSPLVTIKTFMGYLAEDLSEGDLERVAQDSQFIHNAADKMKLLLDDLLEMSRIGRVESPPVSVSLRELLTEALDALAGVVSERKADIHLTDTEFMLFGDRQRLCQIWQNLIENSIKYSHDDRIPRIELGVQTANGEPVFFIKDNGIGIESKYHSKVFGIFDKLNPRSSGAGLGLSMVKRIVENCGGRIWVESKGRDTGACFLFTLPQAVGKN